MMCEKLAGISSFLALEYTYTYVIFYLIKKKKQKTYYCIAVNSIVYIVWDKLYIRHARERERGKIFFVGVYIVEYIVVN